MYAKEELNNIMMQLANVVKTILLHAILTNSNIEPHVLYIDPSTTGVELGYHSMKKALRNLLNKNSASV